MKEVTSLFERQRSGLAESVQRLRELEQEASTAKKETGLAQEQVRLHISASYRDRAVRAEANVLCDSTR